MGEMIPANQINFSQMERENETFGQVMYWARVFVNVALFSLIIHEGYILLLATLGVGTYLYGNKEEEKATLKAQQKEAQKQAQQEEAWRSRLDAQRYQEWLRRHR